MNPISSFYEFGPFRIDTIERQLLRDGSVVPLGPKAFDMLLLFVTNSGHLLDKQQLIASLWPDTVVEEGSLFKIVFLLRSVLGDGLGGLKYIETVPKRGYRFTAPVKTHYEKHIPVPVSALSNSSEVPQGAPAALRSASESSHGCSLRAAPCGSVAVMPFENISSDIENEYFSDGLAEEIINSLTHVPEIRVPARTSAFRFRGSHNRKQIGHELNVRTILEGSVRKAGNRIRVTVQLISVADDTQIWSERYDCEMTDIFAIQDEIAQAVVDRLTVKIRDPALFSTRSHTDNLEAYHSYLEGRYHWYKLTPDRLERSRDCFQRALTLDPGYALAYVGLADYYYTVAALGVVAPNVIMSKARAAVEKALELDDTLAEAHATLGVHYAVYEFNWTEANREFRRAIDLNPNGPLIRYFYGLWYLRPRGRLSEALGEIGKALDIDPLSPLFQFAKGYCFYHNRQFQLSLEQCQRTIALDPSHYLAYMMLGMNYLLMGRTVDAIVACEKAIELFGRIPMVLGLLADSYSRDGRDREALDMFAELNSGYERGTVSPGSMVWSYTTSGQLDRAFECLERAIDDHDFVTMGLKTDPLYDKLRGDYRYDILLRRMHLADK